MLAYISSSSSCFGGCGGSFAEGAVDIELFSPGVSKEKETCLETGGGLPSVCSSC